MAKIIDGKSISNEIRKEVKKEIQNFSSKGKVPGLAVILVGDNPSSQVYVRMKSRACDEAGIYSITDRFSADIINGQIQRMDCTRGGPLERGIRAIRAFLRL